MNKETRYKLIVMYQGVEKVNKAFDVEMKRLAKKFGYKFIGSGYDFTNDKRDMEFCKVVRLVE